MISFLSQGVLKTAKVMMDLVAVLMTLNILQAPQRVTLGVKVKDSVQQT